MKRNILLYVILILVLGGVAWWLLSNRNETSTIEDLKEQYNFTVQDTSTIDKIVLSDKTPSKVSLVRTKKGWMVDGEHPVRDEAIQTLLETLYRMEMRNFIPERMQETVIKRMSVYGTDVKVYQNGELTKHFTVGTDAEDEMATYMMMKGAENPFAVHIPGFNGFLSTRFFTQPHLWRKRIITQMNPGHISKVEVSYSDSTHSSFTMNVYNDSVRMTSPGQGALKDVNMSKVGPFLTAVSQMRYEGAIIPTDPIYKRQDSLLASTPVFEIEVTARDGEVTNLQGYRIKGPETVFDPDLEAPEYDPDRLHGFINEERMILIQYYGLKHVLKPASYFTTE